MTGVYILGTGVASHNDCTEQVFEEPVHQASKEALKDAGLTRDALDSVMMAGYDAEVGRTISNMYAVSPAGGLLKDEGRITDDGIAALAMGAMKIRSGGYDLMMLTAYGFPEGNRHLVDNVSYDPLYVRELGMTDMTANALQAERYVAENELDGQAAAEVVAKNRQNGAKNPHAYHQEAVDVDEAASAEPVALPLREHDVTPPSYGVVSMILGIEEYAARYGDPVHVDAVGWSNDTYYLGEKDLTRSQSLEAAASDAYERAGIEDPRSELDLVELTEVTPYHELIAYEALGLCESGKGADLLADGVTAADGELPVNLSGGALSWDPSSAAGLAGVLEVVEQIRGRAGSRQLDDVSRGLAHGNGRNAMQTNAVAIVGESDV